jgi:drug/metabolite transporter (DMT)-like permease
LIGGLALAVAAAACYEGGYVLQALEAREAPERHALRPSLLRGLAVRPRWLAGTALALAGAGLQVVALTLEPITVVQPVLALGLVALLALAHVVLGERIGRRELVAVGLVAGGVVAVGVAAPGRSGAVQSDAALAALLAVLAGLAAAPYVRRRSARAGLAVAGAASGDALAAIALKLVADAVAAGRWPVAAAWAALAALAGSAALTAEMSALQRMAASRVAPVIVGAQVVVPAAAGVLVFGEHLGGTPLGGAVVVAGIAATGLGAALLGASRGVGDLLLGHAEAEARQHDAGGGGQRCL